MSAQISDNFGGHRAYPLKTILVHVPGQRICLTQREAPQSERNLNKIDHLNQTAGGTLSTSQNCRLRNT